MLAESPVPGLTVTNAQWHGAGLTLQQRGASLVLPVHCEVTGTFGEHSGLLGGPYRIGFRMRLPAEWNGRYLFQGGGGSNGVVGNATGPNGAGNPTALERGYAVISQDSGHDNERNLLPSHGGNLVFGHDPRARSEYGHTSLYPAYQVGRQLVRLAYGAEPRTKLFWGCSKGGQEGMAFAQRYPDAFDGIVAAAPGMSLPRAAVAQAWDTQQFARILTVRGETPTLANLSSAFSPAELGLVRDAVLETCDADDGTRDGVVGRVGQCTTARVRPALAARQCTGAGGSSCLRPEQVEALVAVMDGARDSRGRQLYAPFPWDTGLAEPGWRSWKLGSETMPANNVLLGGGALAAVFTSPPTPLAIDPAQIMPWQLAFDFDRDVEKIYAVVPPFQTSAWQDIGMRSADLSAFRARGGKLIIPHGVSDPVFSVLDTIAWWREVDAASNGQAGEFVRVFPVPGMNHCNGGAATDRFDSLAALESWAEQGKAPNAIPARAGPNTPWPGRERPLCPYPQFAVPTALDRERFVCGDIPAAR